MNIYLFKYFYIFDESYKYKLVKASSTSEAYKKIKDRDPYAEGVEVLDIIE